MTTIDLGRRLREMYETPGAKQTTMIHLFGIIYADEINLAGAKSIDIVKAAGIKESYKTEVSKGMNLAKYVELKPEYIDRF